MNARVVVRDAVTLETLPGAAVVLLDADGNLTLTGAATDADGMATLAPGTYQVSFLGYHDTVTNLVDGITREVLLSPDAFDLPGVEVFGRKRRGSIVPLLLTFLAP